MLLLLLKPIWLHAAALDLSVTAPKGEVRDNVMAWLGTVPESKEDRLNFVISARDRVKSSLQALGFYKPDIKIDVQRNEPEWRMKIVVDPGEPVRYQDIDIEIAGAASDDPQYASLQAKPGFAQGDALHHAQYQSFRNRLLYLAQQRGYFDAAIASSRVAVNADAGRADVSVKFDSGPRYRFGDITYDAQLLDPRLLNQLRTFQPGEYYEQRRLQSFQDQLQRTGYFSGVVLRPLREQAQGDAVPIALTLSPAKRHSFETGIGYSTDTRERFSVGWRTPRINRYGHSQVTRVEYSSVNPSGRINYNIPLTHPLDDKLQLSARTEENEFGDINSQQDELSVRREIRQDKWVYGYSLRSLDESWELEQSSQSNEYLLLGGSLSRRTYTGSIIDPEGGFNQLYTLEGGHEGVGSDVNLLRLTANWRYVFTPIPGHRIVTRAELGAAEIASGDRSELAPSLNFFTGGSRSIRGFSYQSIGNEIQVTRDDGTQKNRVIGGDRLATASLEYQYYFNDTWRGAVFADAGDAFDDGEFDLNYGAGVGIHYISPVGAIRLEVANSLSDNNPDWTVHINIGAEF